MSEIKVIGDCTLILGNAADIVEGLDRMEAMITDPPYGMGNPKGTINKHRQKNVYDGYIDNEENIDQYILPAIRAGLSKVDRAAIFTGSKFIHKYPPHNRRRIFPSSRDGT